MDDLEDLVEKGDGINFIPCVKWVKRGAAKSQPEKVKFEFVRDSKMYLFICDIFNMTTKFSWRESLFHFRDHK